MHSHSHPGLVAPGHLLTQSPSRPLGLPLLPAHRLPHCKPTSQLPAPAPAHSLPHCKPTSQLPDLPDSLSPRSSHPGCHLHITQYYPDVNQLRRPSAAVHALNTTEAKPGGLSSRPFPLPCIQGLSNSSTCFSTSTIKHTDSGTHNCSTTLYGTRRHLVEV